ncbi:MAG: HYC_CC_PP family protein [Sphingobacteriales bacterium]
MKKFFVAILAFIYLVTTSGVVVTIHYCMGKLSSAEYGAAKTSKCDKCGMQESQKKKGCCHTENKIYKLDDSHNYVKSLIDFSKTSIAAPEEVINMDQPWQGVEKTLVLQYHSPPDKRCSSVYLYNCVFRI